MLSFDKSAMTLQILINPAIAGKEIHSALGDVTFRVGKLRLLLERLQ